MQVLDLSSAEKRLLPTLSARLNAGESEAIILSQIRRARLLSNDKRAIRYCEAQDIQVLSLPDLLRLLWIRRIISQDEVRTLIAKMKTVEGLTLSKAALNIIFAPRSQRRNS